ncbi:MAG: RnfABCDGE type electron transport complex subunit B [Fusobacterium sp.]|uniref:RnfABCDGE type electron transport complex subunit B n=1 Tax=Fusobacterium sp. TaxID=68766 RepID=UPI0026DC8BA1|nr:RnfABCDGE type electron transport complex subunit B [Fusobacterium sp.]MDO4689883.1 RnfABCDGE type electron transport complex subunit B [Fusobacterium sp.]
MEAIMMPVVIMGITGILMGLFLAFASKKFEVEVDPKVEAIMAILPGVNCGGCGYPGCTGYAIGVVEEGISMTLCAPGGPKVAQAIGDIMGVAVEMPVKKKPEKKKPAPKPAVPSSAPAITASKEFIEKNKKSLNSYKEAFDAKDEEKMTKLEELAKKVKKDELLKYYDEIKAGMIVPDPNAPAASGAALPSITASKEFIEKNKKSLNSFKEAFDAKDEEKMTKLEELAKKVKKDELLKYYEEIKKGLAVPDPATMGAAPIIEMISATKEFIEKNKKSLNSYKEAFDAKDEEKMTKLEELAKKVKKDELIKFYEEIKAGKAVPDPATMPALSPAVEKNVEEKKEKVIVSEKEKEEQAANYCSVLGDGLCVPEQNEEIIKSGALDEILEQPKVEKKELSPEERAKADEAANYCSVLGDGLCVPEHNEEIAKVLNEEVK